MDIWFFKNKSIIYWFTIQEYVGGVNVYMCLKKQLVEDGVRV